MNIQTQLNIKKNNISTVLSKITIFIFLMVCAIFGDLANTITALSVLALLIYVDIKMRGA
jgi:hypothetical protein